ncbi:MAG TPA: Rossmann-like and DUF2520 domain-containing protein [Terriglobales bacterium]|nr:Rossmann-like and DUF2520 domain-containing protein [Terriglobales bacterium]
MPRKPPVTIIGPGRLGTALTLALHNAGYGIDQIVTRTASSRARVLGHRVRAKVTSSPSKESSGGVVWICVPDTAIHDLAHQLAAKGDWSGKHVFHSSGALPSTELMELKKRGAHIASVHPMMSFVHGAAPSLNGVSFAIEGDPSAVRMAKKIVKDLGGVPIGISARNKPLYHAFGAFASPMLISVLAIAEHVGQAAGLSRAAARKAMLPIVVETIRNYENNGAAGAFSGPIIRGDAGTVRKNLASLKSLPEARRAYVALAHAALRYLPAANRKKLQRVLKN